MSKIAILIDSCTNVPDLYREKYKMYTLPLAVIYKEGEYLDGVNITPEEVYERFETAATVDGTGGEPLSGMRATGGLFAGKDSKAKSFDGVSYTVEGNVMVVSVPIPKDIGFDPYELTWMELATGDGAYPKKIKIR